MNPGEDFDHFERSIISNLQLTCATIHANPGTGMWRHELCSAVKSAVEEFDGKVISNLGTNVGNELRENSDGIVLYECSYGQNTIRLAVLSYWKSEWDEDIYEMSLQLMFAKLIATSADYKLLLFEAGDEKHITAMIADFTRMLASSNQNQGDLRYLFCGWHILDEEFVFQVNQCSDHMQGEHKVEEDLVIPNKWLVSLSSETTAMAELLAERVLPWKIEASLFSSHGDSPTDKYFFERGYFVNENIQARLEEFRFSTGTHEIVILLSFSSPMAVNTVFELVKLKPKSKGKIKLVGIRPDGKTNTMRVMAHDELMTSLSDDFDKKLYALEDCVAWLKCRDSV